MTSSNIHKLKHQHKNQQYHDNNNSNHYKKYTCISCLHPTSTLYKQYSTKYNIKLQQCIQCNQDVDKYIEYEWILICMDVVLMRKLVYRHLVFNYRFWWSQRLQKFDDKEEEDKEEEKKEGEKSLTLSRDDHIARTGLIQNLMKKYSNGILYFTFISFLRTMTMIIFASSYSQYHHTDMNMDMDTMNINNDYLLYLRQHLHSFIFHRHQQQHQQREDEHQQNNSLLFLKTILLHTFVSMIEYSTLYVSTLSFINLITHACNITHSSTTIQSKSSSSKAKTKKSTTTISTSSSFGQQVQLLWKETFLALFLPPLFLFVSLFVHIFENNNYEQHYDKKGEGEQQQQQQYKHEQYDYFSTLPLSIVQLLTKIFIFSCTYMTIHCVVERILYMMDSDSINDKNNLNDHNDNSNSMTVTYKEEKKLWKECIVYFSRSLPGWPFLFGYILKSIILFVIHSLFLFVRS